MNPDVILWAGSGAVVGAVAMAVALIRWGRVLQRPPVETPTREYDVVREAFDDARAVLEPALAPDGLPFYIADAPGIPLSTAEERVIRDIEAGLGDPEFRALFEGPTPT